MEILRKMYEEDYFAVSLCIFPRAKLGLNQFEGEER